MRQLSNSKEKEKKRAETNRKYIPIKRNYLPPSGGSKS